MRASNDRTMQDIYGVIATHKDGITTQKLIDESGYNKNTISIYTQYLVKAGCVEKKQVRTREKANKGQILFAIAPPPQIIHEYERFEKIIELLSPMVNDVSYVTRERIEKAIQCATDGLNFY